MSLRRDTRDYLQGMQSMELEPSVQAPQVQHAGRGDRVARTREAIVSSTLTLAMEGEVAPIVRDIAKLAGVSARTVFQHFADTAELYVAVLGRVLTGLRGEAQPTPGGALDDRITAVIGQRAGRYEKLLPMWTFVETLQRRSSEAGEQVNQLYTSNREQLAEYFGEELTGLSGEKRDRAARAPRPDQRSGARGVALHRQGDLRRSVVSRHRLSLPALRGCGRASRARADVRACCAHSRCSCRSCRFPGAPARVPWRAAACRRTAGAPGRRDRRAMERRVHRRDGSVAS